MEDTYENRALFVMMWFGDQSEKLKDLFPEWYKQATELKCNNVEETIWFLTFCEHGLSMKAAEMPA